MSQNGPNSQNEKGISSQAFKVRLHIFNKIRKTQKRKIMYDTMEQFWKAKYQEANEERYNYLLLASKMTGYYGSLAKQDNSIPKHTKIRMLQGLIDMWNDINSNPELTQSWIKDWKKEIETLSK